MTHCALAERAGTGIVEEPAPGIRCRIARCLPFNLPIGGLPPVMPTSIQAQPPSASTGPLAENVVTRSADSAGLRPSGPRRSAVTGRLVGVVLAVSLALAGCDYFAEKKLVPGQHTENDVRTMMGVPDMIWEEPDGRKTFEYPRGPAGTQTYFVRIGPDGKYLGMDRVLVDANFAKVQVGQSKDDVRRILGRATEIAPFPLAKEEVWSWRYEGDDRRIMFFNAHFDQATSRVRRITRLEDWKTQGGP
jgi:hypothetical protein